MIKDLPTARSDREKFYYAADGMFKHHLNIFQGGDEGCRTLSATPGFEVPFVPSHHLGGAVESYKEQARGQSKPPAAAPACSRRKVPSIRSF